MQQIQMRNFFVQGCNMFGDTVPPASPWCSIQMVLRESREGRRAFCSFFRHGKQLTMSLVICCFCYFPVVIEGEEKSSLNMCDLVKSSIFLTKK